MARCKRPVIAELDKSKGLAILVLMDACRSGGINIVAHYDWPVIRRNVLELGKTTHVGLYFPDVAKIASSLLLQSSGDFR